MLCFLFIALSSYSVADHKAWEHHRQRQAYICSGKVVSATVSDDEFQLTESDYDELDGDGGGQFHFDDDGF